MEYVYAGGLIVLALNIWAVVSIWGSSAPGGSKLGWSLFVLLLPVVGFIVWLVSGPRADARPDDHSQGAVAPVFSTPTNGTR